MLWTFDAAFSATSLTCFRSLPSFSRSPSNLMNQHCSCDTTASYRIQTVFYGDIIIYANILYLNSIFGR